MLSKLTDIYLFKRLLFISFLILGIYISNLLPGVTSKVYAANIYTCTNYESGYRSTPFDADGANMALSLLSQATTDLSNAMKSLNSAPPANQQFWINKIASLASSRHDLLLEVVRYNPDMLTPLVSSIGLSDGDKALILNNSTNCYEVEKTIEGTVNTSNRANPDGSSKTEFGVTTAEGKTYYLRAAVSLNPELVPGMKIKVKGYILDNEIAFDGSNSANLTIVADKPSSSPRFALASVMASPSLKDCVFTRSGVSSSIRSSTLAQWIWEGAQETGVPPAMLAAFTKVETEQSFSWGDDNREITSNTDCHQSGAGAVGLLQVMSASVIPGRPSAAQLCNIQFNIRKGAEIFRSNVIQFAGTADFNNENAVRRAVCAYGGYSGAPSSCKYGAGFDYANDVWTGYKNCTNPAAPKGIRTEIASVEAAPGGNVSARGGDRYAVRGSLKVVASAASSVGDIQGITFHLENNVPLGSVTKIDNDTYQAEGDSKYLDDGNHTLTAVANSGGQTGSTDLQLLVDNTPPSLTITNQPAGSGPFSGELHVTANASDSVSGISKVVFFMDGSELQTKEVAPFAIDIDMTPYINGNHTLSAQAFDGAENTLTVFKQIQVLNGTDFASPEQVNIVQPGKNSDGTAILSGWFKVDAYDSGSGIKRVDFYQTKDGGSRLLVGSDISNIDDPQQYYAQPWDPAPGSYKLEAKAIDNGNNESWASITVRVGSPPDNLGPEKVNIVQPGRNSDGTAILSGWFKVDAHDNGSGVARVEFYENDQKIGEDNTNQDDNDPSGNKYYAVGWNPGTGIYNLKAKAIDNNGNYSWSQTLNITVGPPADGVGPEKVNIVQPGRNSDGTAILSGWFKVDAHDNGSGVARVEFYENDQKIGEDNTNQDDNDPSGNKYYAVGWNPGTGIYNLKAKAIDNNNNFSQSQTLTVTINPVNNNRSAVMIEPGNGATVARGSVHVVADAHDPLYGVSKVEFHYAVPGGGWQYIGGEFNTDNDDRFGTYWNTSSLPAGDYVLIATAISKHNNEQWDSNQITVHVPSVSAPTPPPAGDTAPPEKVEIRQPYISGDATIFTGWFKVYAHDNGSGVAWVDFYLNGNKIGDDHNSGDDPDGLYAIPFYANELATGSYDLKARACDNKTNCADSMTLGIYVNNFNPSVPSSDATPPTVTITSPDPTTTRLWSNQPFTISANVTDLESGIQKVEFYYDNKLITNCTKTGAPFTCTYTPTSVGFLTTKTIGVKAYDKANNSKLQTVQIPTWW